VQAYPNSLLCKLADDDAPDAAVLARSSDKEEQRKPIAIDRDAQLFEQVLLTSLVTTVRGTAKGVDSVSGLWAELDFYGLLPMLKDGELPVAMSIHLMPPAALLTHESEQMAAKKQGLLDIRAALETKKNIKVVSLLASQMSELIDRSLLTDAQHIQCCEEASEALRNGANLDGTDWSLPLETALSLAPLPPATVDRKQVFVVITRDDGQPQVVSMDPSKAALPPVCANSPPKEIPAAMKSLLRAHLTELGYTVTMDSHPTGNSRYTRITVSWK